MGMGASMCVYVSTSVKSKSSRDLAGGFWVYMAVYGLDHERSV